MTERVRLLLSVLQNVVLAPQNNKGGIWNVLYSIGPLDLPVGHLRVPALDGRHEGGGREQRSVVAIVATGLATTHQDLDEGGTVVSDVDGADDGGPLQLQHGGQLPLAGSTAPPLFAESKLYRHVQGDPCRR